MTTLVMKFGGTSVGDAGAISQTIGIVQEQAGRWDRAVVVVSAMSGVTDALTRGALTAAAGDEKTSIQLADELQERHLAVGSALLSGNTLTDVRALVEGYLEDYRSFCRSIQVLGEVTPRALDAITSLGERINARIVAAALRERGTPAQAMDATELIITDSTFQNAIPLMDRTRAHVQERLRPASSAGRIPVVTGFIGATPEGVTTTLGRGGSDYSAAILGSCLDADEVQIWTDVDGVMSADPRIVPNARVIPLLSYSEVGELAYFGAKVVHARAIRPVVERGIRLWVKNTFRPSCAGTRIVREAENSPGVIKAVTAVKGLSMITVEGRGMIGVPGIAARTFSAVASQNTSVLMISQASSEQSICFVIPTTAIGPVIRSLEEALALELARRDIDRIWSLDHVVIVTAVGAGMRGTIGVASRIFGSMARGNINVIAIAQGSSECSVSLVVEAADAEKAVRRIHAEAINHAGPLAAGSET